MITLLAAAAYSIRMAKPEDAATLAEIDASVYLSPRSAAQFAVACAADEGGHELALVVECTDHIGGYLLYSQVLDEASVYSIAVAPCCQRRGLGKKLLNAALSRMQADGALRCLLEVRQSNVAARALYENSGFVLDGIRRNYYPARAGREDALLMSKELKG